MKLMKKCIPEIEGETIWSVWAVFLFFWELNQVKIQTVMALYLWSRDAWRVFIRPRNEKLWGLSRALDMSVGPNESSGFLIFNILEIDWPLFFGGIYGLTISIEIFRIVSFFVSMEKYIRFYFQIYSQSNINKYR